jgi:hypothetical protein
VIPPGGSAVSGPDADLERWLGAECARRTAEYVAWLCHRPDLSEDARALFSRLAQTIATAIDKGPRLAPADLGFCAGDVARLIDEDPRGLREEWRLLATPFSLGIGSVTAPVVVMGTEAADAADETLAFLGAGGCITYLCDGRWDVLQALSSGVRDPDWQRLFTTPPPPRPYHRDPIPAHLVANRGRWSARHTWSLVADVVADGDLENLWRRSYQLERSTLPARVATAGVPPDSDRRRYLVDTVVPALRRAARILILHGNATQPGPEQTDDGWTRTNRLVTETFLEESLARTPLKSVNVDGKRSYAVFRASDGSRLAIWCRALSGRNVTDEYVSSLAREVRSFLI